MSQVRLAHYPPVVDWRDHGVLTPVSYNGNHHDSCYADATRAAIEGIIAIASGQKKVLSSQELMAPCYREFERKLNPGWKGSEDGGRNHEAYQYVSTYGLSSNLRWPLGVSSVRMNMPRTWIDAYVLLPANEEELILRAIAQHPVTAILDVYQMFELGLIPDPQLELHAVVIVGYDTTTTPRTITFQNNTGADWGIGGCGTLSLDGPNCWVKLNVSYPVLEVFPSALNRDMENLGRLYRRNPLGTPAILRLPYVLGGSVIGIRYNNGVILSSDYGYERLKPVGMHSVISVEEPIWKKIKDAGAYKSPVDLLKGVVGVLSSCHTLNPSRRPFVIIAGVQNGKIYLGKVMGPSHHHNAEVLQEQLENMDVEDWNHGIVADFDTSQACSILERGWHNELSLTEALELIDAVVMAHLCHQLSVLEIANVTERGVSFFRRSP